VITVQIGKGKDAVATASGRFMIREGSRNLPATGADITRLLSLRSEAEAFPYEILEHEFTLTLHDASGASATLSRRRARVRFLRDRTFSIRDRVWGDGVVSPITDVEPGIVVDQFQEGDQLHSLISLREPKRRGELETVRVTHEMVDCFRADHEWFEVDVDVPTRSLRVEIHFPRNRAPRTAWVVEYPSGNRLMLGSTNIRRDPTETTNRVASDEAGARESPSNRMGLVEPSVRV